jgi:hypothetical protein
MRGVSPGSRRAWPIIALRLGQKEADDDVCKFIPMGGNRRAELGGLASRPVESGSLAQRLLASPFTPPPRVRSDHNLLSLMN